MTKQVIGFTLTAKCISNEGYEMEFVVGDSYRARIVQFGALSVIGRDNESYIYPAKLFEVRNEAGEVLKRNADRTWTTVKEGRNDESAEKHESNNDRTTSRPVDK